jgi:hypothetical protein
MVIGVQTYSFLAEQVWWMKYEPPQRRSITPEICGTSAPTSIRVSFRCYRRGSLARPIRSSSPRPTRTATTSPASGSRRSRCQSQPIRAGLRAEGLDGCDAAGQKIAFARTKAERLAAGDPRPSLEERYVDHGAYVSAVTRAAQALKAERFLLDEDVAAATVAAQAASVP